MVLIYLFLSLTFAFAQNEENIFNQFNETAEKILSANESMPEENLRFNELAKKLEELEYREGMVEKIADRVAAHQKDIADRIYHFTWSLNLQYVSWQQEASLKGPSGKDDLVITNRGVCAGGDAGLENNRFHFYVDACALYGSGGVKNVGRSNVIYQQSNLPAYGLKAGPGASYKVSSTGSRVGLRIPFVYSVQELTKPSTPGYSVSDKTQFSTLISLYTRWHLDRWYFQTEFGKYLGEEQSFWGLGLGRNF